MPASSISGPRLARLRITGWIDATASPVELVASIRAVAEGRGVSGSPTTISPDNGPHRGRPTPRELEVLALVERGLITRAIADHLKTTPRTVHFHVGNLFTKCDENKFSNFRTRFRKFQALYKVNVILSAAHASRGGHALRASKDPRLEASV